MVATGNASPVARCAQHPSGILFGGIFPGDITGSEDAPTHGGANPEASAPGRRRNACEVVGPRTPGAFDTCYRPAPRPERRVNGELGFYSGEGA